MRSAVVITVCSSTLSPISVHAVVIVFAEAATTAARALNPCKNITAWSRSCRAGMCSTESMKRSPGLNPSQLPLYCKRPRRSSSVGKHVRIFSNCCIFVREGVYSSTGVSAPSKTRNKACFACSGDILSLARRELTRVARCSGTRPGGGATFCTRS